MIELRVDGGTGSVGPRAVLAPWQAHRVVAHIDANLGQNLRLSDLAAIARLSSSYFSRAFKGSFGKAPHAFIIERRIVRAQQEMLSADDPLSQIAIACGFADQAHLSRAFRRLTGRTPHAWRRARRPHAGGADFGAPLVQSPFQARYRGRPLQPAAEVSKALVGTLPGLRPGGRHGMSSRGDLQCPM
jgi:AraC-like DNA-binding protein